MFDRSIGHTILQKVTSHEIHSAQYRVQDYSEFKSLLRANINAMQKLKPMTLGNMRAHHVRSLSVTCDWRGCNHQRIVNVDSYADDVSVPSFGPRMRCERCKHLGADVRPNWNEQQAPGAFKRN